jgi:D-alanine-D-alanine ligase
MGDQRLRVGLLFGGRSGEHEVSLRSARSILSAIDREKYEVVLIGITKEGVWVVGPAAQALLDGASPSAATGVLVGLAPTEQRLLLRTPDGQPAAPPIDVVFPILHGPYGEDGTVQGLLDLANVPYVGAGVLASAVGMDKAVMKSLFRAHGLPVVDFLVFLASDWAAQPAAVAAQIADRLGYPCFVKPANLGSSVGVSRVTAPDELGPAMDLAAAYDRKIVVEAACQSCREIECSVLGNDAPEASVPGEVVPRSDFYDYAAKYLRDDTALLIPAPLTAEQVQTVQRLAIAAFRAIDCAGLARVDFFLTPDGRFFVNEINTLPGFTQVSMYPKLWEASGLPYPALIDRLITLARERHAARNRLRTTYR